MANAREKKHQMYELKTSWNKGTSKSSIFMGFSIVNHPCWVPPSMETTKWRDVENAGEWEELVIIDGEKRHANPSCCFRQCGIMVAASEAIWQRRTLLGVIALSGVQHLAGNSKLWSSSVRAPGPQAFNIDMRNSLLEGYFFFSLALWLLWLVTVDFGGFGIPGFCEFCLLVGLCWIGFSAFCLLALCCHHCAHKQYNSITIIRNNERTPKMLMRKLCFFLFFFFPALMAFVFSAFGFFVFSFLLCSYRNMKPIHSMYP